MADTRAKLIHVLNEQSRKKYIGKRKSFRVIMKDSDSSKLSPSMQNCVNTLKSALDYAVTTKGTRTKEEKKEMKKCLAKIKFLEDVFIRVLICREDLDKVLEEKSERGEVLLKKDIARRG